MFINQSTSVVIATTTLSSPQSHHEENIVVFIVTLRLFIFQLTIKIFKNVYNRLSQKKKEFF